MKIVVLVALEILLIAGRCERSWCQTTDTSTVGSPRDSRRVLDVKPIRCVGNTGMVYSVAISPDGKAVVSGAEDTTTIAVWSTADGTPIRKIQVYDPSLTTANVPWVAITPDGKSVAASTRDGVRFWELATGNELPDSLPVKAGRIAFSPDGTKMIAAEDLGFSVWSLTARRQVVQFHFNPQEIGDAWRVAFSPNGDYYVVAMRHSGDNPSSRYAKVRVFDANKDSEVFSCCDSPRGSVAVGFSHDSRRLAVSQENTQVWNLATKELCYEFKRDNGGIFCLAFSPDGKYLATGGTDSAIRLRDATTGVHVGELRGHIDQVKDLAFSADGEILVSGGRDGMVLIWPMKGLE